MKKATINRRLFNTALAVGLVCQAVSGVAYAADKKLVLTGSSTIAPLMADIAKRFEEQNPGVQVDVQSGGSGRGISDARQGLAGVGMVSRALKPDEFDLKATPIALDGVTVIVNKANPVKSLTNAQIVSIYTGVTKNWKEVGGRDEPITVVNKAEGRSTLELFTHFFKISNKDIKAHVVIGENQQGIKTVGGNKSAIGYVSIGTAEFEEGEGAPIRLLPIDGVVASVANVQNQTFPLMRPLNLVTKGEPTGLAKQLVDFAKSTAVRDLVKEQYFVALNPQR